MIELILFILGLVLWSAFIAYVLLFKVFPAFFKKKDAHHGPVQPPTRASRPRMTYSSHEGFSSLKKDRNELTIDDIVKALSQEGK